MKFTYLRVMKSTDEGREEEMINWLHEGDKIWRTRWTEITISREMKRILYDRPVISSVVYGFETLSLSVQEKRKPGV